MLKLRCRESELRRLASRYPVEVDGDIEAISARARARGYLDRAEFLRICEWKTPRSRKNCRTNSESLVGEASRIAFAAKNDEIKIGALRILSGVEWPTASVILHLCDRAPYPILDVRAMWSIGFAQPPVYTFKLWSAYTRFVRELSRRNRLTMRDIDRALWQYSKEKQ